jgi:hypothetical protein
MESGIRKLNKLSEIKVTCQNLTESEKIFFEVKKKDLPVAYMPNIDGNGDKQQNEQLHNSLIILAGFLPETERKLYGGKKYFIGPCDKNTKELTLYFESENAEVQKLTFYCKTKTQWYLVEAEIKTIVDRAQQSAKGNGVKLTLCTYSLNEYVKVEKNARRKEKQKRKNREYSTISFKTLFSKRRKPKETSIKQNENKKEQNEKTKKNPKTLKKRCAMSLDGYALRNLQRKLKKYDNEKGGLGL